MFSLTSFASMYTSRHNRFAPSKKSIDSSVFASRLWGDKYFDRDTRRFSNRPIPGVQRSFVEFILEPLYKLYSHVVGESREDVRVKTKL